MDHASSYAHAEFQAHLNSHETLKAKGDFEKMCQDAGVVVMSYPLTNNGTAFTSKQYREHLQDFQQVSRFAGVGAHHHNGKAEHAIQTIMSIVQTMMLHALIHWPNTVDAEL